MRRDGSIKVSSAGGGESATDTATSTVHNREVNICGVSDHGCVEGLFGSVAILHSDCFESQCTESS